MSPQAKTKSTQFPGSRKRITTGVAILAMVVVALGFAWGGCCSTFAAEPASLSYVPENSILVGMVRPAELLARPDFATLAKTLKETGDVKKGLGVELEEIERATLVIRAQEIAPGRSIPNMAGIIVKTTKPASASAIVKSLFAKAATKEFNGQKFYLNGGGGQYGSCLPVDDVTLIISGDEENLRLMAAAGKAGAAKAKWATEWKEVSTAVAGAVVHVEPLRESLKQEMQNAPPGFAPVVAMFSPFYLNANTMKLVVGLEKQATVTLAVAGSNEEDGKKLKTAIDGAMAMANGMLGQFNGEVDKIPGEEGVVMKRLHSTASGFVEAVKVAQTQSRVVVTGVIPAAETASIVALMVPAVGQAREAARRTQSANNLKQIGLAMHNYHDSYGKFPAAVMYGPDETTTYSWRVALLPFLDQAPLYNEYNQNEPWDSEGNKKVLARMPAVFRSPTEPAESTDANYYGLVGLDTIFVDDQAIRLGDITDGSSNTLMIVEAKRAIPWTKPEDIPYEVGKEIPKLGGFYKGGFNILFCDGAVRFVSEMVDQMTLRGLITPDGGEVIGGF